MNNTRHTPKPNDTELTVLKVLWDSPGGLTMRALHEASRDELSWSLSSTRTTVARMEAKGLVGSQKIHGVAVYAATVEKVPTLARLAKDFMSRVLEMSGPVPTAAFTGSQILSEDDIAELQKILDDAENGESDV